MARQSEPFDGNDSEELRQAILALTRVVETNKEQSQKIARDQAKQSRNLEKKLESAANSSEHVARLTRASIETAGLAATTGVAMKRYGVAGGLGRVGTDVARTRIMAQAAARAASQGPIMRAMMAAVPALRVFGGAVAAGTSLYMLHRGLKANRASAGSVAKAEDQQANWLRGTNIESIRTNKLLEEIIAEQRQSRDPFQRGMAHQMFRARQMGEVPTRFQTNAILAVQAQQQDMLSVMASRQRIEQARRSTRQLMFATIGTNIQRELKDFAQLQQDVGNTAGGRVGRGGWSAMLGPLFGAGAAMDLFSEGVMGSAEDPKSRAGRMRRASEKMQQRNFRTENAYQTLLARGPQLVAGPSPTVRAGGVSDYQFQVQQQMRSRNMDRLEAWQDKVLAALEKLVDENRRDVDELRDRQRRFGRPVQGVN